jgi:hypothetical protein
MGKSGVKRPGGQGAATGSDAAVNKLVQRKVRVTATMDAAVLAYGRAQGKADMAEAYRSIIGRGLRACRVESGAVV